MYVNNEKKNKTVKHALLYHNYKIIGNVIVSHKIETNSSTHTHLHNRTYILCLYEIEREREPTVSVNLTRELINIHVYDGGIESFRPESHITTNTKYKIHDEH